MIDSDSMQEIKNLSPPRDAIPDKFSLILKLVW